MPIVVKAYFGLMKELMVINIDNNIDADDDEDDKYDKRM